MVQSPNDDVVTHGTRGIHRHWSYVILLGAQPTNDDPRPTSIRPVHADGNGRHVGDEQAQHPAAVHRREPSARLGTEDSSRADLVRSQVVKEQSAVFNLADDWKHEYTQRGWVVAL
jgi:hypothetical protein